MHSDQQAYNERQVTFEDLLRRKELDMFVPGFAVSYTPPEAEACGVFEERALDDDDAIDGSLDLPFGEG